MTEFAPEALGQGVVVLRDQMVTLRDGIRLATDVYLPAGWSPGDPPLPVVMERTPYDKGAASRAEIEVDMAKPMARADVAAYFVRHGYAVIYQDCRGRYRSEGAFTKYLSEGEDGFDTMAWVVRQPWCNGRVGTHGLSYGAHTQMALACLAPPGLACMVLDSGGFANAYHCGIRQGGAFELKQATWAYNRGQEAPEALADPLVAAALEAEDLLAWFKAMPWREGVSPVRWVPEYESYLLDQWRSGTFDEKWQRLGIWAEGYYHQIPDIPIALMSSWYDAYVSSTLTNLAGLSGRGKHDPILVMGPWLHGNRNTTFSGDASFGPQATIGLNVTPSWLDFRRRWFDCWLKGQDNGVDAEPRARIFVMGGGSGGKDKDGRVEQGGRWIESSSWPLPETSYRPFHLHPAGLLSEQPPAAGTAPLAYDFDPANPVPTIGGALTSGQPVFEGGAFDQRESPRFYGCTRTGLPLTARADVLTFETAPLDEDMAVIGPIEVELWVSTDAPDTDFTAKLVDVHPPSRDWATGQALIITDGIFRCRYRHSWEKPALITPGELFKITIKPFATACLFKKGHRIRLDVSSSNFPKYDVNPNTGEPEGQGRMKRIAHNSVHIDAMHPSRVILPVVPADSLVPLARPG